MALRKTLGKRLFDSWRVRSPTVTLERSPISSRTLQPLAAPNASKANFHRDFITSPDSAEKGFFRRFLQRRAMYQSSSRLPEFLSLPVGDKLREKLRGMNITGDRLKLDGLSPPVPADSADTPYGISVHDARKILRVSKMEKLKAKLGEIQRSSISYSEFVGICVEVCENEDQGVEYAKTFDESGNVIVLGNVVFLRPEQVQMYSGPCLLMSVLTKRSKVPLIFTQNDRICPHWLLKNKTENLETVWIT